MRVRWELQPIALCEHADAKGPSRGPRRPRHIPVFLLRLVNITVFRIYGSVEPELI